MPSITTVVQDGGNEATYMEVAATVRRVVRRATPAALIQRPADHGLGLLDR